MLIVCGVSRAASGSAGDWPQWRGPEANGVSRERGIPTRWGPDEHVAWKAALPGLGTSTPVVWGDYVFVTSQVGRGDVDERGARFPGSTRPREYATDDRAITLLVLAFHRSDGRLRWEYRVEAEGPIPAVHRKHNLASPSCVTDGQRVYAWFGTGQLLALELDGDLVWSRHLGTEYAPFDILWGHGSSPVLHAESLILLCDHPPGGYLLALDARTGKERWVVDRGEGLRSYSTPFVVEGDGGDRLIVNSTRRIEAIDPSTGELLWHAGEPVTLSIPMPVHDAGTLYASRGYSSGPYMAIRMGGSGDVSRTHRRWWFPTRAPYISSLLFYDGFLYMATEGGIVTVMDPSDGTTVWRARLGGVFTASPVAADGHVYLLAESGETVVLKSGGRPQVVARNLLGERALASLAVSHGRLFIRTDAYLYCIGEAPGDGP